MAHYRSEKLALAESLFILRWPLEILHGCLMDWISASVADLAGQASWAYRRGDTPATEATAWAALALIGHGRLEDAKRACDFLASWQNPDGSLGINPVQTAPHWPTGLAVLAWEACRQNTLTKTYIDRSKRAIEWMLSVEGTRLPQTPAIGHDTSLVGWPWVESTHSWIEPTAINVLALRAAGHGAHRRTTEAVRLLLDRTFSGGGCNYGNTIILGQALRPHLVPSGLALLALAGTANTAGKIDRSLDYVESALSARTASMSLSIGLMGLRAHQRSPVRADDWLREAARRTRRHDAPMHTALLALSALGARNPLLTRLPETRVAVGHER